MIALEAVQLRRLVRDVLHQLQVIDSVQVIDVLELTDGAWMIAFEDRSPDTRFPAFDLTVRQHWTPDQAAEGLRLALRDKLWICPLCQTRARMRRIVDRELYRVECPQCGRFEIEHSVLLQVRRWYERHGASASETLARVSNLVRHSQGVVVLDEQTWESVAVPPA